MAHLRPLRPAGFVMLGLLWISVVAGGLEAITRYEYTPGTAAGAPANWPSASRIARQEGRFTLVLFAHPECPCTRASLAELGRLLTRLEGRVNTSIQFRKPGMELEEARATPLWRTAAGISGVALALDDAGEQMRVFGAAVSGQAMLYDPSGRLVFSGGITGARGHEGANAGIEAVERFVLGRAAQGSPLRTPVFGCSLLTPSSGELGWTL